MRVNALYSCLADCDNLSNFFWSALSRANFNTPHLIVFTPPGVSGVAGAITITSTTSRQVQISLKLLWQAIPARGAVISNPAAPIAPREVPWRDWADIAGAAMSVD